VLALHPHADSFDQGGDEVAGVQGRREHQFGAALAARGFVVLCPDLPGFGQQQAPAGMPTGHTWEALLLQRSLAEGRSLLAVTLDQLRCATAVLLDYEATSDLTVATMGYGLGARVAAWLAFVDRRIDAAWLHAGIGQQRAMLDQGRPLPRHVLLPGLFALGLDQADIVADLLPRCVGISYGEADRVVTPTAVAPVVTALRDRAATFPQDLRLDVAVGAYDHRLPPEVVTHIGDRLLAWAH
jgi:dienelactone hydrolase